MSGLKPTNNINPINPGLKAGATKEKNKRASAQRKNVIDINRNN